MSQIKPINTKEDHKRVKNRIAQLMDMDEAEMPQHLSDELSVLIVLLKSYEAIHYPVPEVEPISMIEFYMEQFGVSRSDLVPCIGSKKKVSQVLAGTRPLTLKMIRALDERLNIPTEMLVDSTKHNIRDRDPNIDWDKFPVSDLAKSNFLRDRRDPEDHSEELMRELVNDAGGQEAIAPALFRKSDSVRQNSKMDTYALKAWCLYVLAEARCLELENKYKRGIVDEDFLRTVAQLSTQSDGPLKARDYLHRNGIALIYAPHLPKTYLDGAAMITKEGVPTIGMTIRYDRIDNFWFCLLHELAHVGWHLKDAKDYFVDDLSLNNSEYSEDWAKEREADTLAQNALIPEHLWVRFKDWRSVSADKIMSLANEAEVHPAVVAGRYRWETRNFRKFKELLGNNQVRKHLERSR